MSIEDVIAVMVHVADVEAALAWYRRAFPQAALCRTDEEALEIYALEGSILSSSPRTAKSLLDPAAQWSTGA